MYFIVIANVIILFNYVHEFYVKTRIDAIFIVAMSFL